MQITHRDTFSAVNELTGAAMTIKGNHYEKGQRIPDGERKLYLIIEGPTELVVEARQGKLLPMHGSLLATFILHDLPLPAGSSKTQASKAQGSLAGRFLQLPSSQLRT